MPITAQQLVDRVHQQFGTAWRAQSADTFHSGNPESEVSGVVTAFAPSLEVLRHAVAVRKNMIISREAPFWARTAPGSGRGGGRGAATSAAENPTLRFKRDYIASNNLVVWRFFDNWNARPQDPQLLALARALGWEKNYKPSGGKPGEGKSAIIEAAKQTATATAPKTASKKSTGKSKKVKAAAPTTDQPKPEESATETSSETPDTPPATPTPEGTTSESSPEGNSAA